MVTQLLELHMGSLGYSTSFKSLYQNFCWKWYKYSLKIFENNMNRLHLRFAHAFKTKFLNTKKVFAVPNVSMIQMNIQ